MRSCAPLINLALFLFLIYSTLKESVTGRQYYTISCPSSYVIVDKVQILPRVMYDEVECKVHLAILPRTDALEKDIHFKP